MRTVRQEDSRSVCRGRASVHALPSGGEGQEDGQQTRTGVLDDVRPELRAPAGPRFRTLEHTATVLACARAASEQATQRCLQAAEVRSQLAEFRAALRRRSPAELRAEIAELRARLAAAERRADGLERAVTSNRRIGMAIGVLLARHLTEQQAIEALRQASMARNVKLRDLAEEVIYTGCL